MNVLIPIRLGLKVHLNSEKSNIPCKSYGLGNSIWGSLKNNENK